jgi:hypothetical protein
MAGFGFLCLGDGYVAEFVHNCRFTFIRLTLQPSQIFMKDVKSFPSKTIVEYRSL